ncbi:MAG: DUF4149 domain-containing protein, partial [Pseudomonadota bacterium]
ALLFGLATLALVQVSAVWAGLAGVMAVLGLANRQVLMPEINRLRDLQLGGDAAAGKRFDLLHKSSVAINMVQMIAAAVLLWHFA